MRLRLLAPLRHAPFRVLFLGQVVSNLGDWLTLLALLSLLLYEWDLGAPAWGAVLTALALPAAVLGPIAGVWADRWPRRTVMIVADLARAVIVLGLIWAPDVLTVIALVGLSSAFSAFFFPAQRAAIRSTVLESDLLAASSLSQLANYGARLIGPAVGGLLVIAAGARAAFVADSLTFVASALLLSRLPGLAVDSSVADPAARGFWMELRAGLRYIRESRVLLVSVFGMVGLGVVSGVTDALGTPVMKVLGVDETMLGPSFTALGLGYVTAAIVLGQNSRRVWPLAALGLSMLLLGTLFVVHGAAVVMALTGSVLAVLVAYPARMLLGVGYGCNQVASAYAVQEQTSPVSMGRVSATTRTLATMLALPAPLLGALASERWGLGQTYAAAGAVLVCAAVYVLWLRRWAEHRADRVLTVASK